MEPIKEISDLSMVPEEANRLKLKEERALRKKEKKAAKQLQKQKEREQKQVMLMLKPMGNNVTLITRDFANKVVSSNIVISESCGIAVSPEDFPTLGKRPCKTTKFDRSPIKDVEVRDESEAVRVKKSLAKIELADFISIPGSTTTIKQTKPLLQSFENYCGNPLDSDLPVRKKGKFREIPKIKKLSKLKLGILKDKSEYELASEKCSSQGADSAKNLLLHCDHIITEELDGLIKDFVSAVVQLQEKLYKRDPIKGTAKRRYIVGFHEVKKYLKLHKVKILIFATDIQTTKQDGALSDIISQVIELAKTNEIPYLFALKRRLLGNLTMKHIPVSCVAVLNHEGLEEQFNTVTEKLQTMKNDFSRLSITDMTFDTQDTNAQLLKNLMNALK